MHNNIIMALMDFISWPLCHAIAMLGPTRKHTNDRRQKFFIFNKTEISKYNIKMNY